jgi:quinohemoprotein ethanol dehydrogenase
MGRRNVARLVTRVASFTLSLIAALPLSAQPTDPPTAFKPSPAFPAKQLVEPAANDWATNGGNLYNQRYSSLAAINRDNVKDLKAVWRTHLNGSGIGAQYSGQGQPLVYDGVIYMVTGNDDVFALDVKTGAILWNYQARLDPA